MRIGRLRHRLTLQRRTSSENAFNEASTSYTTIATVWGAVEPISGREFFAAQQTQSEITHRVTLRYMPGITADDRILWMDGGRERLFDIKSPPIDRDERHRQIELMCVEHV